MDLTLRVAYGRAKNAWFSAQEYPSLAVLVFDSVSANQFRRHMPQTMKFLVDNRFFTMNMYNEMTDDSNANILAILEGGRDPSDTQKFLWDAMKEERSLVKGT
ncbi:hypothetical protein ANCDUO_07275 [Ancylostoma duodenale]|uniref:Uncharacterized protein n=1 Tax=Ancylostoma duodenale TaxID=51022 RepID=A0A0C2GMI0_9BILA|nr:hypothetical protein ANCDUO_07275 [Ancylostoma duodenale]